PDRVTQRSRSPREARDERRTDQADNPERDAPGKPLVAMNQVLLPFTHGIDTSAITYALTFAQRFHLTVVALSLIRLPAVQGRRHPRLEAIQQSKDFLEYVQHKAARQGVPTVRL